MIYKCRKIEYSRLLGYLLFLALILYEYNISELSTIIPACFILCIALVDVILQIRKTVVIDADSIRIKGKVIMSHLVKSVKIVDGYLYFYVNEQADYLTIDTNQYENGDDLVEEIKYNYSDKILPQ